MRKTWRVKLADPPGPGPQGPAAWRRRRRRRSASSARNLKALLLAAPAGRLPTLGLDPGLRTGVKVAVVDATGRVAATDTIYPHVPRNQWDQSIARLARLCRGPWGQAHQHRQRDGLAGDRPAGPGADQAPPGAGAAVPGGERGRGLGLFGLRVRLQGAAGPGRLPARGRLHRPAPAGPAGRAGQDRAQGHRRRPVPARRQPGQALPAPWRRWWRTASTPSAWTSTPPRCRC